MSARLVSAFLVAVLLWIPSTVYGQDEQEEFRLVVPLLEGSPAPFSGLLVSEADFRLAIERDAAAERWEREARVFERSLETERILYEAFITEQRDRINELSERSWWDENGALFSFVLGAVLGVGVSALIVGLAVN
jgi:hypothetical protein